MGFTKIVEETRGERPSKIAGFTFLKTQKTDSHRPQNRALLSVNLNSGSRRKGVLNFNNPLMKLINAEYARWGINGSKLAIFPCNKETDGAFKVDTGNRGHIGMTRIPNKELKKVLRQQPNLNLENYRYHFQFERDEDEGEQYVVTDLSKPADAVLFQKGGLK